MLLNFIRLTPYCTSNFRFLSTLREKWILPISSAIGLHNNVKFIRHFVHHVMPSSGIPNRRKQNIGTFYMHELFWVLQNDESTFLFGRRPDRVIENACFDSKLQYSRNTCERKQAKGREFLLCGVSRHSMYPCHIHIKDNARQTNRK